MELSSRIRLQIKTEIKTLDYEKLEWTTETYHTKSKFYQHPELPRTKINMSNIEPKTKQQNRDHQPPRFRATKTALFKQLVELQQGRRKQQYRNQAKNIPKNWATRRRQQIETELGLEDHHEQGEGKFEFTQN